ncbi:nitroreductase family protein [Gemmatimonadota bacterium]
MHASRGIQLAVLCLILLLPTGSHAQSDAISVDLTDLGAWSVPDTGIEVVNYHGRQALRLLPGTGERVALLKDLSFENGTIELDIAALPSYTGLVFRARSEHIYEGIYFRPQNSRHADPVRRGHTLQYHAAPKHTWYYLRERFPERYEAGADMEPEAWFHVRIEIMGTTARVFVNEEQEPSLVIDNLLNGVSRGTVGLWAGNTSGGTFSNLTVTPAEPTDMSVLGLSEDDVGGDVEYTPEQEFLFDTFRTRRSVRQFRPDRVPDEHLMRILDAARSAPTSGNQQPWKFLVITDRAKIDQLRDTCIESSLESARQRPGFDPASEPATRARLEQTFGNYLSAPVYVVVLTDANSRYPSYNRFDGSLAAGYLILAARALGYGTCFITDAIPEAVTREVLGIPYNFEQICITPIGLPVEWPNSPAKLPLRDVVVFDRLIEGVNYTVPVTREAIDLDPDLLDDYPGRYQLDAETLVTVSLEGEQLFLQVTGQQRVEIFPEAEDAFFLRVADVLVTFSRNDEGAVVALTVLQAGQEFRAERIGPVTPPSDWQPDPPARPAFRED